MIKHSISVGVGQSIFYLELPAPEALKLVTDPTQFYWARLWPAGLALARFLDKHCHLVADKQVLEIGAGLGLPGMVAAQWAAQTTLTDVYEAAVSLLAANTRANGLKRVSSSVFNWQHLQQAPSGDVVLLSDVNFNPADDETLLHLIEHYLGLGSSVLLSTPERLWAKPFVSQLLPWAIDHQRVVEIDVTVSILHLACQKTVRL